MATVPLENGSAAPSSAKMTGPAGRGGSTACEIAFPAVTNSTSGKRN